MSAISFLLSEFQTPRDVPAGEAALIALIGFVLVIAVLALLAVLLWVFKLIFGIKFKKKVKTPSGGTDAIAESGGDNDEEIAAVIAAAFACLDGEETPTAPFKIKSITKLK